MSKIRYVKGDYFVMPNREALEELDHESQSVFMWLCAHADENGICFPSLKTISDKSKLSLATVKRRIPHLEKEGLIEKVSGNSVKSNEYQILLRGGRLTGSLRRLRESHGVGSQGAPNNNQLTTNRNNSSSRAARKEKKSPQRVTKTEGGDVNEVMALFEKINPMFENLFKRNSERLALDRMIVKFGKEKMVGVVRSLEESNGKDFAPMITTPMELERSFGKLVGYWRRQKIQQFRRDEVETKDLVG